MKKIIDNILIIDIVFTIIYSILYFTLKAFDITFMPWIKDFAIIFIPAGIIIDCIYTAINKRKILYWIYSTILFIVVAFIMFIFFGFFCNVEEISYYKETKVIKVTHSFWKSNWIAYYEYKNPFFRSTQAKAIETYDDAISESEYGGTTYYDKNGKEVEDFKGTPYVNLSELEKYSTYGKTTKIENVEGILKEIQEKYSKNYSKITNSSGALVIEFSLNPDKILNDTKDIEKINEIIENYIEKQRSKELAIYYNIVVMDTGRISVINTSEYENEHEMIEYPSNEE